MSKPIIAAKTAVRPYAEATNRAWHCVAAPGHALTDALDPGYLSTRCRDMQPGDTFEIRHELHLFLVRGYISSVDRDVGLIGCYALEVIDLTAIPEIRYDYGDAAVVAGRGGWAVMRQRDGAILKAGFATEAVAREWLEAKRLLAAAGQVAP